MRTEELWNKRVRPGIVKKFPSRIKQILETSIPPKDLPNTIESTFLYGKNGAGKTILAAFMLVQEEKNLYLNRRVYKAGEDPEEYERYENSIGSTECVFITLSDLMNRIKKTYNKNATETESDVLEYYQKVHLLVLDDFGTEMPTDWMLHILYSIINYRYDWLKKTIITSNPTLETISVKMNDTRITSRIDRMCEVIEQTPWNK